MPPARRSPEIRFTEKNAEKLLFSAVTNDRIKIKIESHILSVNQKVLCQKAPGFIKLLREKPDCPIIHLKDKKFEDINELMQCIIPSSQMKIIDKTNAIRLAPLINEFKANNLLRDVDKGVGENAVEIPYNNVQSMVDMLLFAIENNLPETIRKLVIRCAFVSAQQYEKLVTSDIKKYKTIVLYLLHIKQQLDLYRRQQSHQLFYVTGNDDDKRCVQCLQNGPLFYCQVCKKYFCPEHYIACNNHCTHCENCGKEIPPKFIKNFQSGVQYCFCTVRLSNSMIGRLVRSKTVEIPLKN